MTSKFQEALGYVRSMMEEDVYNIDNRELKNKYNVDPSIRKKYLIDKELMYDQENFAKKYPYYPNPLCSNFYNCLYPSFNFLYEVELILDEIECFGLSLNSATSLLNNCNCILKVLSSEIMIGIDLVDDKFSYQKKYSVAEDIHIIAKKMYDTALSIHANSNEELNHDDVIEVTKYDKIMNHMYCKFIRNGVAVLKLFHILILLQVAPVYTDDVHQIANKLIKLLREVLFNKRIMKIVIDNNTNGNNQKSHKTTRLKIYFIMGNSDRYCIRLDFPHEGEENIHLNINQPAYKQSTGFPFNHKEYNNIIGICKDISLFDKLFYHQDDLYWFRSNYTKIIKAIKQKDKEQYSALKQFHHEKAHIHLSSSNKENMSAVTAFSKAFAEAMIEFEKKSIYGNTDSSDDEYFQYILFQDFILDSVIKIRSLEIEYNLYNNGFKFVKNIEKNSMIEAEKCFKSMLCKYIEDKFAKDEKLMEYTNLEIGFYEFISKCLNHIERIGI